MDTITNTPLFSSAEACALADISYRQLDYWCRIGTVVPTTPARGSGTRRRWTRQEVLVLAVLGLVGGHVRVSLLDELAALLYDWDASTWDTTTLLVGPGGVWLPDDSDGAPPVATAINLGAIRRLVAERARELQA